MTTATRTRKPIRTAKLYTPYLDPSMHRVLTITAGAISTDYRLVEIASDFGRGFRLEKIDDAGQDAEVYHTNIDGPRSVCDCKGHNYRGTCRHVESLGALVRAGKL